jgi:ribosomal protein RSM22 (predicted rRNA methylase)
LRESITMRMWEAARVAMVAIEPGTPSGFARVRGMRAELLTAGAHIVAPCPGAVACPMEGRDWCHFAARVERSSLHRRMKDGELGYEDEKYSYVAVTREAVETAAARILRRPRHLPGFITIETCTAEGLKTERIGKRDRERFRAARRASWGDSLS